MRGFREVGWVAAVAGTALGCYMVNLKVASERASLEDVENRIVLAQRDIRVLQTEIGTRGRLEQLESWNVKVLALSAPQAQQFLEGGFQLATLTAPRKTIDPAAPVVLASAEDPAAGARALPQDAGAASARDLMRVASLKRDLPEPVAQKTVDKAKTDPARPVKPTAKAVTAGDDNPIRNEAAATPPAVKKKAASEPPAKPASAKAATAKAVSAKTSTDNAKPKPDQAKAKDVKAR